MHAEAIRQIMMLHGLIDHFKLHQEEIHYGDRHIKITILLSDMQELFILHQEQMLQSLPDSILNIPIP